MGKRMYFVYKYLKDILTSDICHVDKIYRLNEGYIEGRSGSAILITDCKKNCFLLMVERYAKTII